MDRGANGGILGCDANVILIHTREVDVTGIDNHELNALKLVDATAKVITQLGPAIVIRTTAETDPYTPPDNSNTTRTW